MTECIDLEKRWGKRYRLEYEGGAKGDPWLAMICCRYGHIYPHGGTFLGAATNSRGRISNQLSALPCVRVAQDGDDGINVVFDVADFDKVAKIIQPKRRRKINQKVMEAGRRSRY